MEQSVLAQRSADGGVEAAAQQIAELRASMANPGALSYRFTDLCSEAIGRQSFPVEGHTSCSIAA